MATKSRQKPTRAQSAKRSSAKSQMDAQGTHLHEAMHGDKDEPLERGEVIRMALGVLLLALAAYTMLSVVSHFFTGDEDQKVLQSGYLGTAQNWGGYLGAWWGDFWVTHHFGIGSLFIPVFFFATALRLTGAYHVRLWKWFLNCAILMCWVSVAGEFFLSSSFAASPNLSFISAGGAHGAYVVSMLESVAGSVGTFLIIVLTLLAYLCYLSTETIRILQRMLHPQQLARELKSKIPFIDRLQHETTTETDEDTSEATDDEASDKETSAATVDFDDTWSTRAQELSETQTEDTANTNSIDLELNPAAENQDEETQDDTDDIPLAVVAHENEEATPFTIEQQQPEELADENHETALEPYDPKLDLENYQYPTLNLLKHYDIDDHVSIDMEEQNKNKDQIVGVLRNFGVEISSIKATVGPTITLYEITPAPGVRISKIRNLEDDIALSLAALGIRIIAPIPGKGTIGIEVPNAKPQIVSMESILNSKKFAESTMELPMALGKTITNEVFMADLAKMPHLLVAGATGQGKSVGLNAIITSLLYKKHPAELKFVMVDPKKVEFSIYSPIINHFLAHIEGEEDEPITTDVQKVVNTLKSLCVEMDTRYDLLKRARAKNIKEYNEKFRNRQLNPEHGHKFLPYIVVIIDEFGDLIMTAGKEIELPIARIAQLARAVGMHMIIATQRPTTNIITGTIKANFPARMAFRVSAMIDSRTILDRPGANQLIGKGDMLFLAGSEPVRLQCAFVDTPEVEAISNYIARQQSYSGPFDLPRPPMEDTSSGANDVDMDHLDPMFSDVAHLVVSSQQGSTSMIQRKFSIGFNRAGRLMDQLEKAGIVGPAQGSKPREVLIQDDMSLEVLLNGLGR